MLQINFKNIAHQLQDDMEQASHKVKNAQQKLMFAVSDKNPKETNDILYSTIQTLNEALEALDIIEAVAIDEEEES